MYRCALHRYGRMGGNPIGSGSGKPIGPFSSLRLPASQHGFRDEWETLPYRSCSQRKLGAGERSRTFTTLQSPDFESGASASSATPANKNLDVISAPRVTRRPSFFLRDRRRAHPADLRMLDTIRAGVHRLGEGPTSGSAK
jgi:hypothetical protein